LICEQAGVFYAVIGMLSLSSIPRKNRGIFSAVFGSFEANINAFDHRIVDHFFASMAALS